MKILVYIEKLAIDSDRQFLSAVPPHVCYAGMRIGVFDMAEFALQHFIKTREDLEDADC